MSHDTRFPPGTKANPLSVAHVNEKARDLMEPVLGQQKTAPLIERINALEHVANVADLRLLLTT